MFAKNTASIAVVNDNELHFLRVSRGGEGKTIDSLPLDQFLSDDMVSERIPEDARHRMNTLLIVPDYWFGNESYEFQSQKKSLAEAFVERKLQADYPDRSAIKYFFDFTFYKNDQNKRGLYVYFLQDPKAFQLFDQLSKFNQTPLLMTTPALIWESKIKRQVPDFQCGSKGLIQLIQTECFLYFYFQGHFLFSRSISLPDFQIDSSERFKTLIYEINQSLHLFSQKAKAEIDRFYLVSPDSINCQELSSMLAKDVEYLDILNHLPQTGSETEGYFGPIEILSNNDLLQSKDYRGLCHKVIEKAREWKPVQTAGIVIGLILLFLLGSETWFLLEWSQLSSMTMTGDESTTQTENKKVLQQYNAALDFLLTEAEAASPGEIVSKMVGALPDNVWIKEVDIRLGANSDLDFKGMLNASGSEEFRNTLANLIYNLNQQLAENALLSLADIDFEIDNRNVNPTHPNYLINFKLDF
jgi:hypothetical protein